MSNIVRRDPFAMDELFDDLLKGYWVRPMRMPMEMPEMQSIRMDVKEDDKAYTVHAEMPGVKKEDIHVSIDGGMVSVSAEVKRSSEKKDSEKVLRSERYYGKVSRSFGLGQDVDESAANATFKDGVLELVLPKKATAAAKKLTIN
jgi:HSP20 family protein